VSIASLGVLGISIVPIVAIVVALVTCVVDRLQRQRALLNELFEQAPQPVALVTEDHRVLRVNRAFTKTFGYEADETVGRRIEELIVPHEYRLQANEDGQLLAQGIRLDVETVRQRKDGTRIRTALTRVPVSLAGGKIVIYGMYRDITSEKTAEEALRKSEASLRDLLDERQRLSEDLHDHIVQAIYGLGMQLERLLKKGPPEVGADLKQVIDGLNQVIRDARQYISGSQPRRLTPPEFRAELMKLLEAPSGGTRFEIEIDAAALESLTSNEMQHVLHVAREALSNTLRHARANHATLVLERAGEDVRLEISDDGVGFDPSQLNREGRGLQNMESRARQMSATLDVASRAGQGSRIVLTVPMGGARAASAPLPD
jgi:PAS domain S-box-containing protein